MISIDQHANIYQLKSEQTIQATLQDVWTYFSEPKNLNHLTPHDMKFKITSGLPDMMYQGQIITYKIEIIPQFKQNWVTEIKHVEDKKMFVDEQRFGPYAMWHHEHHFKAISSETVLMNDIVSYKLPFGFVGKILAGKIISQRVRSIFEYREQKINEIFASAL